MTSPTRRRVLLAAAAAGALVLAACGTALPDGPGASDPSQRLESLRLEVSGGFTTLAVAVRTPPQLVLTRDGRLITPAPVPAIYPGPMLLPLTTRTVDEAGRTALGDLVRASGLVTSPPPDLGRPGVADAPTTTLTVMFGGATTTLTAPALDEALGSDPALTPEQQQARSAFRNLVSGLRDLSGTVGAEHLGPEEPYRPPGVWLLARPAPTDHPPQEPAPVVRDWPVPGVDLARLETATLLEGASAAAVLDALAEATELTWFREPGGSRAYEVLARAALPGDTAS